MHCTYIPFYPIYNIQVIFFSILRRVNEHLQNLKRVATAIWLFGWLIQSRIPLPSSAHLHGPGVHKVTEHY